MKSNPLVNIKKLIELAKVIISSKADSGLILQEYLNRLQDFELYSAEIAKGKVTDKSVKPLVIELAELHQAVIERIEAEKNEVKERLASLKKKGKVVISYTDQLPKSISLKTRKKI